MWPTGAEADESSSKSANGDAAGVVGDVGGGARDLDGGATATAGENELADDNDDDDDDDDDVGGGAIAAVSGADGVLLNVLSGAKLDKPGAAAVAVVVLVVVVGVNAAAVTLATLLVTLTGENVVTGGADAAAAAPYASFG